MNFYTIFLLITMLSKSDSFDSTKKPPIMIKNKFITLINNECNKAIMITPGPSNMIKKGSGKSTHSLISDYSPWISISEEIKEKHDDFDIIIDLNNTKWFTQYFSCDKFDITDSIYLGINGWSIITGKGVQIYQKMKDINYDSDIESSSSKSIILNQFNFVAIIFCLYLSTGD